MARQADRSRGSRKPVRVRWRMKRPLLSGLLESRFYGNMVRWKRRSTYRTRSSSESKRGRPWRGGSSSIGSLPLCALIWRSPSGTGKAGRVLFRWCAVKADRCSSRWATRFWTDAYLAAFARSAGMRLVSFDAGFARFDRLDCLLLEADR